MKTILFALCHAAATLILSAADFEIREEAEFRKMVSPNAKLE
jgi:hypothetical protein